VLRSRRVNGQAQLLTTIARCPIVERCITDPSPTHDCSQIVLYQWPDVPIEQRRERWQSEHHLPEPWVGHLETAPLLFLSSNPNLASRRKPGPPGAKAPPLERLGEHTADEHPSLLRGLSAPKSDWTDEEIIDRYTSQFDVFMTPDGTRQLLASGQPDKPVPYWRAIKRLADHLYGRQTRPGIDYALTEVVRCKSPGEIGVGKAVKACAPLYLTRTLALSPASVICVVGRVARMQIRREYTYPDARQISEPMEIEGRERLIVFVSGPNARAGRTAYPKTVPEDAVGVVRDRLATDGAA
jgi:hypothetical protein